MTDTQDGESLALLRSLETHPYLVMKLTERQREIILAALRTPPAREREAIARIIDPDEWLFFDNANAVTKMQKPVSLWRIEPSLAKADAILALSATPASPVSATNLGAGALAVPRPDRSPEGK